MLRTAAILLTATGVLWHALVGCCAHHAHGSEPTPARPVASATKQQSLPKLHQCVCKRRQQPTPLAEIATQITDDSTAFPVWPEDENRCNEQTCSFIGAEALPSSEVVDSHLELAWQSTAVLICVVSGHAHPRFTCRSEGHPPSLRRHLEMGVLLT